MSAVWEPWRPEIGQRVRVRISPECVLVDGDGTVFHHAEWHDGVTGVVYRDDFPLGWPNRAGHRFAVKVDQPVGGRIAVAAIELEPVDA
jgi:hypothetical protein